MNKYQALFMKNLDDQLDHWYKRIDPVRYDELYPFLHSLKGTSGTIELHDVMAVAQKLLNQIERTPNRIWTAEEVHSILHDLRQCSQSSPDRDRHQFITSKVSDKPVETEPSVLILDDDINLLMQLKEELHAAGWSVIATNNPHKAIEYIHDVAPDCFILDPNIPETDGFKIIELMGEKLKKQYIPTTILSVDCSKSMRIRAFRLGVDDVICKPVDIEELLACLQRQINGKRRLDRLLFIDELTGALNRKYFQEYMAKMYGENGRLHEDFSLAILDLDRFKLINDTHGHLIGDQVLTRFTQFMKDHLRMGDLFIRYGGEEFVLILPKTNLATAKKLLSGLIEEFAGVNFYTPHHTFSCTFSAGLVHVGLESTSIHLALEKADQALYEAKNLGRRRVVTEEDLTLTSSKRKLKLAIIDDDALLQCMLSDHLNTALDDRLDIELTVFRDGESFFAQLPGTVTIPYLVLLDGLLPGMDGLEVLQRIRDLPQAELFTVIMLTGRTAEQDIVKALQLGADDYVTKPFRLKELEARIRRLIRKWL